MARREGIYRFVRQSGRTSHYARVTLEVEEIVTDGLRVHILPTAFAWLKDDYGPGAWEWPVCEEYRIGALSGVAYALRQAEPPLDVAHLAIHVTTIHAHPAHSSGDDVAYAAAFALWQACDVRPRVSPRVEGGHVIFPSNGKSPG